MPVTSSSSKPPFATGPDSGADPKVTDVRERLATAYEASAAPPEKAKAKLDSQNKLFVRDRIALLFDEGSFVEDGRYANAMATGLPADGVVTGRGTVDGRPAIVVANDPTVKAGSWGARTVEKIVRATEMALREELPLFWFVDSAGARITDQVDLFPGRRGAGRIFHNQVALSGKVPQICCLFGPSAAGGAYIPSFTDSADKAARFIWLCDAYSIPLIYLADVPGFMIGSEVERGGIIRHGAKMVSAVSSATVPQFCVIVRKAYGAGLYAMGGPGFAPDATIALPTARIAVMGPEAAVNAVYANKIAAIEDVTEREAFVQEKRREYEEDVDLERLASDLVLDQIIEADALRAELLMRLRYASTRDRHFATKRRDVPPV